MEDLLEQLAAGKAQFAEVLAYIETHHQPQPAAFTNGTLYNSATQNQGSAKVFALAQLHQLSPAQTLSLFAEHYHAVLADPEGTAHQNIRQFISHGWAGLHFESEVFGKRSAG
jgi:hypothetical protein